METPHSTPLNRPMTTALAIALLAGWIVSATAQEPITWTNQVNVAARGATLEKTRGCDGCGDAGATSRQSIRANDGYAEFRVNEDWTYLLAGLGSALARPRSTTSTSRVRSTVTAGRTCRRTGSTLAATSSTTPATCSASKW